MKLVKQKGTISGDYWAVEFGGFTFRLSEQRYRDFMRSERLDPENVKQDDPWVGELLMLHIIIHSTGSK